MPTAEVEAVAEETAWAAETALEGVVDALDLEEVAAVVGGLDLLEVSTLLLFSSVHLIVFCKALCVYL